MAKLTLDDVWERLWFVSLGALSQPAGTVRCIACLQLFNSREECLDPERHACVREGENDGELAAGTLRAGVLEE